jgi:urate oxidase
VKVTLGANQYGKAETRIVRVGRTGERHDLTDLNVSVALAGDLADSHLHGDNANVLPTDSQKNTVYAFARRFGIGEIEAFGLRLAQHFVDSQPAIHRAQVSIEQFGWRRLGPHSFERTGGETRTATVSYDGGRTEVVSGLTDLVLLNSTDSEFHGFVKDPYTTLKGTRERILASAVTARWRHYTVEDSIMDDQWAESYAQTRRLLVEAFVDTYSLALQQTLFAMGQRVLEHRPEIVEVRLSLPNKHHFLVDLTPFDLDNPDEIYLAADRPYGLIEGTVQRDDAEEARWSF